MLSRLLVAAFFIPLLIFIMLFGEATFFLFSVLVIGVSLYEFYTMLEKKGVKIYKKTGIIIGSSIPVYMYLSKLGKLGNENYNDLFHMMFVFTIILFISRRIIKGDIDKAIMEISYTMFGIVYIGFLFSHFFLLQYISTDSIRIFGVDVSQGRLWALSSQLLIWASDSAAYFVGINIGKHKLIPKVSPKKSVEGAVGAVIAPILALFWFKAWYLTGISFVHCIILGALIGVFGQLGDLGESLFKREFEIKDSGNFLMGHGGMWDRFDSLIFVAPIVYYYLKLFVF